MTEKSEERGFVQSVIRNKRVFIIASIIIVFSLMNCFFRIQTDDEKYYMMYDFSNVPDEAYDDRGIIHADETVLKKGDMICDIPPIHLESGSYTLQINHQQDTDSKIRIMDHDNELASFILPATELDSYIHFDSERDLYHFTVQFIYQGGTVDIKHMYIRTEGLFYTDTLAETVFIILFVCFVALYFIRKDIIALPHKERLFLLAFPFAFVLVNYVFFREYWQDSIGGDYSFWIGKIEQTKNELISGQFPVQIYGEALNGHGVLGTLYPSLFIYIPAVFRILHISMSGTLSLTFCMINGVTMFTSYYAVKHITGRRITAFVTMIIYTTLPYRLGCLYYRIALGELLAMIFVPVVILGLYEILIENKENWIALTLGMTGIFQSHILTTLEMILFCVLACILMLKFLLHERRFISLLKTMIVFALINLWYLVPFFDCWGYDLRLEHSFAVRDFYNMTYEPSQLFTMLTSLGSANERYKTPMIGPGLWVFIAMLAYFFVFSNNKKKKNWFIKSIFIISCLFLFMQLRVFPWQTLQKFETIKKIAQMIQFPTRFGLLSQAGFSIAGGMVLAEYELYRKNENKISFVCVAASIALFIIITDSWIMQGLVTDVIGELKIRPDIDMLVNDDYALEQYAGEEYPDFPVSSASISEYNKYGTHVSFDYYSETDTFVDLPIQAYPGYRAFLTGGSELKTDRTDNAMLRIYLPKSENSSEHVVLDYIQPAAWRIALLISLTAVIVVVFLNTIGMKGREKA